MNLQEQAELLAHKIKHQIISRTGRTCDKATTKEFYQAFSAALREEMMINWTASVETIHNKKPRVLNFLSMEYLPGRLLGNNICNLNAQELVKTVLQKMNRKFEDLFCCEEEAGLGNGGLGRLSSCFLDSLATLQYPARGYGLRYQYGIFEQEIWNGIQVEKPDCWLLNDDPWEMRRDSFAVTINFRGTPIPQTNQVGDPVYLIENSEEVRALPYDIPIVGYAEKSDYSVLLLRLWSTKESPRNFQLQRYNAGLLDQAAENTSLTDVLYPNDNHEVGKRIRLKQEFLLVGASLQDIIRRHLQTHGNISNFADKTRIQINDTHPALIIAELVRVLTKNFNFSWKAAWEACQECCSYTNHTILRESLEEWKESRVQELLPRQHLIIQKLNQQLCDTIRAKYPGDEERVRRMSIIEKDQIRMAHLAIFGSHRTNGVAKLHSEILKKEVFHDFYDLYPERFINVTNGVTQRRWLLHANPLLADFITKRIGKGWVTDFRKIEKLSSFASDPESQKEFLLIKEKNKNALLHFLSSEGGTRNEKGKIVQQTPLLPPTALFDVQIKRVHEYKRQLLNLLHLIMVYQELVANPASRPVSRLAIFAGKAAPGYQFAKEIIRLISAVARKFSQTEILKGKLAIVFVENYSVSKAEQIIPAADLSEQISTAGWEASGTGNMKLAMNGALTIGTDDGANIEMREAVTDRWWPFRFGATAEENKRFYHPRDIYLKDEAIRRAVDSLCDSTLAASPDEALAFQKIHFHLTEADTFRVLQDLRDYYNMQKKVEELFLNPLSWAETALHNIASMGRFSTDESIKNYAEMVWNIEPCPPDTKILDRVRTEYLY